MRFVCFLLSFSLAPTLLFGAVAIDVSMLRYADYKEQVIRRPLLEALLADTSNGLKVMNLAKGSILFQDQKYDSALAFYQQHQKDIPEIEGQVLMRMARCQLELGHPDSARALLFTKASILKNRPWWERADRILAEALLRDTSVTPRAKLDSFAVRISAKPSSSYHYWLRMQQALLLQNLGALDSAQDAFVEILDNSEWRASALAALRDMKDKIGYPKSTKSLSRTILRICKMGDHEECAAWVDTLLVRPDLTRSGRTSLIAAQANAMSALDLLDSASQRYHWLLDSVELRPGWMQSLMRISRKLKKTDDSKQLDSLFRSQYPYSPENANNLWVKALELEQDSLYLESYLTYSKLLDPRFGRSPRRQWAAFRMGYVLFKQGLYLQALEAWEPDPQDIGDPWPLAATQFFRAECFVKLHIDEKARQEYIATIRTFPLSWYAHRARQQLRDQHLLDSAQIPWIKIIDTDQAGTLRWIRNHMPRNRREEVGSDERAHLVELLFQTGFDEEARQVLSRSINAYGRRPDFLYELGQMYDRVGEYGQSYRMAREFLEKANRKWMAEIPRPLAEFLYPMPSAWRKDAERYVKPPVDLYFLFGVMRQESIFIADISSPVGARGLLQIMPQTGSNLAKLENVRGFHPDLLFNPIMAIRLGSRYLNDLLLEYGGDPVYALANYNAGPSPAKRWQAGSLGLSLDAQVEEISYWETRDYVKKVMGNYWTYQTIYGNKAQDAKP